MQLRFTTLGSTDIPYLRAACNRLIEEVDDLLDGAQFLLEHHPTPLAPRWAKGLRDAVAFAESPWDTPEPVKPLDRAH